MTATTLRARSDEIVRILRAVRATDSRERRTTLLRDLAEASVAIREHYLNADGEPDWTGRTYAYRTAMCELYTAAGYSPEEADSLQSSVRYHVGNVIRTHLSPTERADAGLIEASPTDTARAGRRRNRDRLEAARAVLGAAPDASVLHALAILTNLDLSDADDPDTAAVARHTLAAIIYRAQAILADLDASTGCRLSRKHTPRSAATSSL